MKNENQKTQELIAYLKEAKKKQLTIDIGDLMERFSLDKNKVRSCVNYIF